MSFENITTNNIDLVTINRAPYSHTPAVGPVSAINVSNGSGGWSDTGCRLPVGLPTQTGQVLTSTTIGATATVAWVTPGLPPTSGFPETEILVSNTATDIANGIVGGAYLFSGSSDSPVANVNQSASVPIWIGSNAMAGDTMRFTVSYSSSAGAFALGTSIDVSVATLTSTTGGAGSSLDYNIIGYAPGKITLTDADFSTTPTSQTITFPHPTLGNVPWCIYMVITAGGWNAGNAANFTCRLERLAQTP